MAKTEVRGDQIKDQDITVSDIADGAVTLAKMANMATGSLIYRKTAGTGIPEVNTLATLKTDLLLTGTNSGDVTVAAAPLTLSGQQITFNYDTNIFQLSGNNLQVKNATTALKGIASFASADFSVTSGAVSLGKDPSFDTVALSISHDVHGKINWTGAVFQVQDSVLDADYREMIGKVWDPNSTGYNSYFDLIAQEAGASVFKVGLNDTVALTLSSYLGSITCDLTPVQLLKAPAPVYIAADDITSGWSKAGIAIPWTYASATTFTVSGDVTGIYLPGLKLRYQQSRAFTNDPAAGANIELNMADTTGFVVGNRVLVSSLVGQEYATITVVHTNVHITVDNLAINHNTTAANVIAVKYAVCLSSSYSAGSGLTTVTFTSGLDYQCANVSFGDCRFSYQDNPQGWPDWFNYITNADPSGWTCSSGNAPAIGSGIIKFRFKIQGKTCFITGYLVGTATGTATTYGNGGNWIFTLPVAAISGTEGNFLGDAHLRCNSQSWFRCVQISPGASIIQYFFDPHAATNTNYITYQTPARMDLYHGNLQFQIFYRYA